MASQMDEMDRDAGTRPVRAPRTTVVRGQTHSAFVPWHLGIFCFQIGLRNPFQNSRDLVAKATGLDALSSSMSRAAASPTRRPGM
jgi:hypothetical protein